MWHILGKILLTDTANIAFTSLRQTIDWQPDVVIISGRQIAIEGGVLLLRGGTFLMQVGDRKLRNFRVEMPSFARYLCRAIVKRKAV